MELSGLNNQRIGFITFRAHVSQPQVFEDFMSVFLPYISLNFSIYTYSIEKDDSPDRHLHMAVAVDEKIYDTQKFKQKIEAKWLKEFNKRLSLGPTDIKHAYVLKFNEDPDDETKKIKMNQLEHKMKIIGYIHKEINRRTDICGLSQSLITTCCDFYFANRRMENKVDKDWKIISTRNIHVLTEQFCKEHELDVMSPMLQHHMVKNKYTFCQLSKKQRKMAFAELRYNQGKDSYKIRAELEGEDSTTESDFFSPDEIMSMKNEAIAENKRLIAENNDLRRQLNALKNKT